MKKVLRRPHLCALLLSTALGSFGASPSQPRIRGEINDNETFRVSGNRRLAIARAQDLGEVSSSLALPLMRIHFAMTAGQRADLQQLAIGQVAPGSSEYHKWLTPEEFGARFGPNAADIDKVSNWLAGQGFSHIEVGRGRMFISFEGTAGKVQAAFHTPIHNYLLDGEKHFANAGDPQLPKAMEGMIEGIKGLHDFRLKPHLRTRPHFTSSISGNHYLAPDDFATIYDVQPLYQTGIDGTGQSIVVAGQSDIALSDIRNFRAAAGLPARDPQIIVTGPDPGTQVSDEGESDLDIEWSGGVAKNATIIFVTARDVETAETYAVDNNVAPVLSISYGLCESQTGLAENNILATLFQQANAQGMTVVAASGDQGAADCDSGYPANQGLAVDLPAALPSVTGVGGTTLNDGGGTFGTAYWSSTSNGFGGSALSYIPEAVWNDSSSAQGLSASGGGASSFNTKPSWQLGPGVPNDGARDVPDVSFTSSPDTDPHLVCQGGNTPADCTSGFRRSDTTVDVVGGTSTAAPAFAGVVALMNQVSGTRLGNINPRLYSLAALSSDAFHDIAAGNNIVPCTAGSPNCPAGLQLGYSATAGYDLATGLGSVDAYKLVREWTAPASTTSQALGFVPLTPCRLIDTRLANGSFGGPELAANSSREFNIPSGACGIPGSAVAYALNVTVVPDAQLGYLSIWPSGQVQPLVSTLNSDGRVKANAAIVPAGVNGGVNIYASNSTHVVVDINGYFIPPTGGTLAFYPLTPCRVADTRVGTGSLGGPFLAGGQARSFPVRASACNVPANAQAYSLNFTAVPHGQLGYLAAWPAGQSQPLSSTLNSSTGTPTANAAIIPAGASGAVTAYASNPSDVVIDINGYFAPAGAGGLSLYTLTPCRVVDTRVAAGSQPFAGALQVNVTGSGCNAPSSAQAYVLNATVVPSGELGYLALWPFGQTQPVVSTLNADYATVTSNMAIVPAGSNGSINAYASDLSQLILDISGYFAP